MRSSGESLEGSNGSLAMVSSLVVGEGRHRSRPILYRCRERLVDLRINHTWAGAGKGALERASQLARFTNRFAPATERFGKGCPIVIGQASQFIGHGTERMRAQPDVAQRAVVHYDENDRQPITRGGGHLNAVHLHAAITRNHRHPSARLRALHTYRRRYGPAHRSKVGCRYISASLIRLPVVAGKRPMRSGIDHQNAVRRKKTAPLADYSRWVQRRGFAPTIFNILQARL